MARVKSLKKQNIPQMLLNIVTLQGNPAAMSREVQAEQ
jgi:hypothetical protein